MKTIRYNYWQEDAMWLGYLEDYPDYRTQGETHEELQENLKDIFQDVASGVIPNVKRVGDLQIA
jgi:predicted RNase H-like HicB family nuclease